ncbi:unnamed protein product [Sphagnum balticum]
MATPGAEQENSVVWICAARYEAIELEARMAGWFARRLQARESHLQMLRQLTMDKTGNSVLSNAVTLDSLVPVTRNLTEEELKQCVKNAKTNALHRLWMQAPHVQALPEVDDLVTMGDFLLALRELKASSGAATINTSKM